MKNIIKHSVFVAFVLFLYKMIYTVLGFFPILSFLFDNIAGVLSFILLLIISYKAFNYSTEQKIKSVEKTFTIFFMAFTINSILNVPFNILIHDYVDVSYKNRVADYKIEQEIRSIKKYESEKNVTTSFDSEGLRESILANYSTKFFLFNPIRSILINCIVALLMSAIISKFGTEKEESLLSLQ